MSSLPSAPTPSAPLTFGRVVVLVRDYDEAFTFYQAAFGVHSLFDAPGPTGGRYLHVGFGTNTLPDAGTGDSPVGLWLLQAEGADMERIGQQTGGQPFAVLYSSNATLAVARAQAAGALVRQPLRTVDGATFAHVADLYGNEFVIVERSGGVE